MILVKAKLESMLVWDFHETATSLHGADLTFQSQAKPNPAPGEGLRRSSVSHGLPTAWPTSERKRQGNACQIPATKFTTQLSDSQGKSEQEVDQGQKCHGNRASSTWMEASGVSFCFVNPLGLSLCSAMEWPSLWEGDPWASGQSYSYPWKTVLPTCPLLANTSSCLGLCPR